ncbi:MAG: hypothetical protein R2828_11510 [Saprospiraceae bacterium]
MEPITSTAMIATVVGYLAKSLKDQKPLQAFFSEFTEATVNWIKPLFIKDDQPKEVLENLQKDPADALNQSDAQNALARGLRDTPGAEALLTAMYARIMDKKEKGEAISISDSKNVVIGNMHAGGNIIVGDSNTLNK